MKPLQLLILLSFLVRIGVSPAYSQLRPLDSTDIARWQSVRDGKISNSGQWVMYTISNMPQGSRTLVLRQASGNKQYLFTGASAEDATFTDDSRTVIIKNSNDSLLLFNTAAGRPVAGVTAEEYRLFTVNEKELLLYTRKKDQQSELVIGNTTGGVSVIYNAVRRWWLDGANNRLWLLQDSINGNVKTQQLCSVNLTSHKKTYAWSDKNNNNLSLEELIFNHDGKRAAFTIKHPDGKPEVWLYKENTYKTNNADIRQILLNGIAGELEFDGLDRFSSDDNKIFIRIRKKLEILNQMDSIKKQGIQVEVWSYLDPALHNRNNGISETDKRFLAIADLTSEKVTQLTEEDEHFTISPDNRWVSVTHQGGDNSEFYWNTKARRQTYMIDTYNNKRILLGEWGIFNCFTPDGKYYLSVDSVMKNWLCFSSSSHQIVNLTKEIPIPDRDSSVDFPFKKESRGLEIAGFLPDGKTILFNDRYDLWKVNLEGSTSPVCLTQGYGRTHQVSFRFSGQSTIINCKILTGDSVLLNSFDQYTKENGLYQLSLKRKGNLRTLGVYPAIYDYQFTFGHTSPMKARDKNIYLVMHMSETEAPNYFVTADFKKFTPLSNITPHKGINWIQPRLMTWKTSEGKITQGVLYLPQDFDSTRKYPVIINYYEKFSYILHMFPPVEFEGAGIKSIIPWFTGRGYLVFMMDINLREGHTGENALESVETGTNQLVKIPFVDSTKLGIIGHSLGGYETNYIVTHSSRFAAAITACGAANLTSLYNSNEYQIIKNEQVFTEISQYRMGSDMWKIKDLYIRNSPIFNADKVSTPLLLMANREDRLVAFSQGMEMFMALRRLGKRVWLLQYDHEGHVLYNPSNVMDYLTRTDQFFGHYLQNRPAPLWMTKDINEKNLKNDYEYDSEIKTSGPGIRYDR